MCDLGCDLAAPGDRVTCYDCEADLVTLGTSSGLLLRWDTGHPSSSIPSVGVRVVKTRSPVDKVYTRHQLVIILQGGLVQSMIRVSSSFTVKLSRILTRHLLVVST